MRLQTLLLAVAVSVLIGTAAAQFPILIQEQAVTFGQCLSNADCTIHQMGNGTLLDEGIVCNQATSRCEQLGAVLGPAFSATCPPPLVITVNKYNSMFVGAQDVECDGLIVVELASTATLHGLLRIYQTAAPHVPDIADTSYVTEKFVNHPTKQYIFRGLCPESGGSLTHIDYFNYDGCTRTTSVAILLAPAGVDFVHAGVIPSPTMSTGLASFPSVLTTVSADGTFAMQAFDSSDWMFFSFVGAAVGTTHRVPFGQVFDIGGGVLSTRTAGQVIQPTAEGIKFPAFSGTAHANIVSPAQMSGTVSLQLGFGYAVVTGNVGPTPTLQFLQSPCGVLEGYVNTPLYLPLSSTVGLVPQPGFRTPMFFTLEGVNTNTKFVPLAEPDVILASGVDLALHPRVDIFRAGTGQTLPVYGMCSSGAVDVRLNYTAFGFMPPFTNVLVQFYLVDTSVNPTVLTNNSAVLMEATNVGMFATFSVTQPGMYCARAFFNINNNVLQTCFQVGMIGVSGTQVRTQVPAPFQFTPGSVPILGFGTAITTFYHTIVPATLVADPALVPRLRVCKMSSNATLMDQLVFFGGDVFDLVSEDMTMMYVADYYTIIDHGRLREYRLRRSRFNGLNVHAEAMTDAAASVFGEVSTIKFELVDMRVEPAVVEYVCSKAIQVNLLSYPRLRTRMTIDQATCPNERSLITAATVGGVGFAHNNPIFLGTYMIPAFGAPTAYFHKWYNDESGDLLFAALNGWRFPAPGDIRVRLESYDAAGNVAVAVGNAASLVSTDATQVLFLPQQPLCANGTQGVLATAVVQGIFDPADSIFFWQPLDVFANRNYDPNVLNFDLPNECTLLDNMTSREVHDLCYDNNVTAICDKCNRLPFVYTGVDNENMQLLSFDDDAFWEAVVWVPSGFINSQTNRSIYCRSANSTKTRVPFPPALQFSNIQRASASCIGDDCYVVTIIAVVDPDYDHLQPAVMFTPDPPFGSSAGLGLGPDEYVVRLNVVYTFLITLTNPDMTDVFCPTTQEFLPLIRGPVMQVFRTTQTDCLQDNGSVQIAMIYHDPDTIAPPATRQLCMFWRDKGDGAPDFYQQFDVPVNSPTSTNIPDSLLGFAEDPFFNNIRGGLHTIMMYDKCPSYANCAEDCTQRINPDTLAIIGGNPAIAFQIRQFTITNFADPGGGIVIDRTNFTLAQCYNDTYELTFEVEDDKNTTGLGNPPYRVFFFEPFTNEILFSGDVDNGGIVPADQYINEIRGEKVLLFRFTIPIETGDDFGFRFTGNYTLTVESLQTNCIATFETFIDIVQPFDLFLTAVPTDCAFTPGALIPEVGGGAPFPTGPTGLPSFSFPGPQGQPGSTIVRQPRYIFEWISPASPTVYVREIRPILNFAGNYSMRVIDRNNCSAVINATLTSPDPIVVTAVQAEGVCQSSSSAILRVDAGGGTGTLRLLQNLTVIGIGTNLTYEIVTSFGQPTQISVIDSVGCLLPTPISFVTPDPGPVNLTLEAFPSCTVISTGRVEATAPQAVRYDWTINGNPLPFFTGPVLTGLAGGSEVQVVATTAIGCQGFAIIDVPMRVPIVITEVERTTNGTFGPPCIDTITLNIMGGLQNTNFTVLLPGNPNNATFIYDGFQTVTAFNICRVEQYRFVVLDADAMCPTEHISIDPGFSFGTGTPSGSLTLPPFVIDDGLFGAAPLTGDKVDSTSPTEAMGIAFAILLFLLLVGAAIGLVIAYTDPDRDKKKNKKRKKNRKKETKES